MRSLARRLLQSLRRVNRKSRFRQGFFVESLERRAVLASGDILISEFMANPIGTDGNTEWVELVATKSINFAITPYSVVVNNNGTATNAGWIAGAALTYGFNISSGTVNAGDVFYVGGNGALINGPSSTALSALGTANFVRAINVSTTAGDTFGNSNSGGVFGNGGANADGIAVFDVATSAITNSTVPIDAVFYGTGLGTAVVSSGTAGYQLPVNDLYNGGKLQSSSTIQADAAGGDIIKATGGTFNPATNSFSTARTWGKVSLGTTTSFTTTTAGSAGITVGTTSIVISAPASSTASIVAADATKNEGSSGNTAFTFTVSRTSSSGAASVNWAVTGSGGNAADATDFGGSLPSGTLSFIDTESSKTLTINVSGDTTVETNEGFTVTLSSPSSGMNLGTTSATGTILNDDSSFSIAALSANKLEGNSGTTSFTFTVTRAGDTTTTATVDYAAAGSGSNPTDAADFSGAVTGTASFAIGATTATVTIDVAGDTIPETDETFDVALSNAVGSGAISAIVGTPTAATGTIQNDDAATTLAIAATDASKAEGNTGTTSFTFTVTRSGVTTGTSSATWTVTGSGVNPANTTTDFTVPITGTVSFAANETSQVITVLVTGDTTIEPNEGFTVTLSAPSSGTAISTATATGLIVNDDLSLSLPSTAISTTEGNSGSTPVTVTVTRTGDTSVATTVDWAVAGSGTNPANAADFAGSVLPSGTVSFAIGDTTQTLTFNIQGDTTVELDETYTLTLSNPSGGAVLGTATQSGTIVTDDVFVLTAGDIAFTGYNGTTTTERVSFVVLRDFPSLTGLNFTDNGVNSSGVFNTNEGLTSVVFTSPVTAGTRFYLEGLALKNFDGTNAAATVSGSASALSNSGDQVTAFQGPISAPSAIIASISSGNYLTSGVIDNSTSYLPTGQTLGTNAIALGGATSNGVLNSADPDIGSTVTGSKSNILGRVNDVTNWTVSTGTNLVVPPAIAFSVGLVTPTVSASPLTKVYDGTAIAISATADDGPGGLAADSTAGNFTYIYYAGPNLTGGTLASAPLNAGSYSVDIAYAGNSNYNPVASTAINFTITPRPVNVSADAQTKIYGGADPTLTYSIGSQSNSGLVGSDVLTGQLARNAGNDVGTYAITQGSLAAPNANYTISYVGANLSITAATLTITADAKSKTVGDADPIFTYTASGLTNGDTASVITGALSRAAGETAGVYPINIGSLIAGSNYSITFVGANLTINPAAAAPTFSGAQVNGSDTFLNPAQRSQVTSVVLTFSAPVIIAPDAFTITNIGLSTAQSAVALANSQILVTGSGTSTITLRWTGGDATGSNGVVSRSGTGARGSSLADGNWQLSIDSSKVTAASGGIALTGNNKFGTAATDNFFRLFGDSNGDGLLTATDTAAFRAAFSASPSQHNAAFDWDGDGDVENSGVDRTNFLGQTGKRRRTNF